MKSFFRQSLLLSFSAILSWWVFLYQPQEPNAALEPKPEPFLMALLPNVVEDVGEDVGEITEQASPTETSANHPVEKTTSPAEASLTPEESLAAATPPPPEAGAPEGEEDGESVEAKDQPDFSAETVMQDSSLLAAAEQELSGEVRKGFHSVFLASAEEQISIGQYFGERMVMVPKSALDPNNSRPYYFEVSFRRENPKVVRVAGKPPLEQFRQYRDLFGYPYNDLPDILRELRRSVLARNEVFLFGVLIPSPEWALAIDRRSRALQASGREISSVQQFVLRYITTPQGGYDFEITSIQFSDGTTYQPSPRHP
ncbi:MAG: hypothetical protein COA70_11810 [Planctomycetota bacterium]|nr:MAG: hypothetical protein COA70_11810 [Planctomycetota bacterium]